LVISPLYSFHKVVLSSRELQLGGCVEKNIRIIYSMKIIKDISLLIEFHEACTDDTLYFLLIHFPVDNSTRIAIRESMRNFSSKGTAFP